jgi:CRP-like cAMP-binding protein
MNTIKLDQKQKVYKNLIRRMREFHPIPPEDEKLIEQAFKLKQFKASEWLIESGKVTRQLFFIISGVLKVTIRTSEDKAEVFSFVKKDTFVTFLYSFYSNTPAYHGLQAACDIEALVLDTLEWHKLYERLPYLRSVIDQIQILFMAEIFLEKNSYLGGDAYHNYISLIKKESEVTNQVALTDVASYLGITPQSLSRIRRAYASSRD